MEKVARARRGVLFRLPHLAWRSLIGAAVGRVAVTAAVVSETTGLVFPGTPFFFEAQPTMAA